MNKERRRKAAEIFAAALDLSLNERARFIAVSCGADVDLRDLIEQLLHHDQEAESSAFLKTLPLFKDVRQDDGHGATPPDPSLAPGDRLMNRYRIDALVGRGGMGEVYRAFDLELGVPVALKAIRPEIASDPAALRQFKQEVLLARSVSHPNVCRIYDLGCDESKQVSFLTMEYLPGETLAARIRRDGALEPARALPLVRQLAEALSAAHRAGIIHRDFKSANIMLIPGDGFDRAVITDFGLAVTAGDGRDAWSEIYGLVGTAAYMSPEQVRGDLLSAASDLYALGVVLYEMSTGRLPFPGSDPVETARAQVTMEPPAPSTFTRVDPEWERTILRLLSKEPAERYPSAWDVVLALEGRYTGEEGSRHALPAERDAFVGRAANLAALAAQLEEAKDRAGLVTILGLGGIGKTRLALRYGWQSLDRWPGGVWFCDLSEARSVEGIVLAVATALNVPLGKTDPIVQLGHAMAGRGRSLVILDNFEQVADHAEVTLGKWLQRATTASFLVTSRERLKLPGEVIHDLGPLDPATHGIGLFEVRAQGHRPGFVVDDGNRQLVRELVTALDGLPLAIELATSRLRIMSLHQIRDRLGDRFRALTGGDRGRHATLRATMDWSWDLLAPWERSAVAQASVFEGGFTLEAAEAVIDLSPWQDAPPVLDIVQSLVNKSWLLAKPALHAPRFGMYVTVQEYASQRVDDNGGSVEVERRHGAYFAAMGTEEAIESLDQHGGVSKRTALHLEIDNLVAACRRAVKRADPLRATGTFMGAGEVFVLTGPVLTSVDLGQAVTGVPGIPRPERARVLDLIGRALQIAGRSDEARRCFEEALAIHREIGNRKLEGVVLDNMSTLHREQGHMDDARRDCEDALAIHREVGNRASVGVAVGNLGILHRYQSRMDEGRRCLEEALAIHREVGNRRLEGVNVSHLGALHRDQGRMDEARRLYEDALIIQREVGDRGFEGMVLGNMGALNFDQGRMDEARRCFQEALAIQREVGNRRTEGFFLCNLAAIDGEQGKAEEARRFLEAALAIQREVGDRMFEGMILCNLGALHSDQDRPDEARAHFEEALAIERELGNRRLEGLLLSNLSNLHREQGRLQEARQYLDEALVIQREVGDRRNEGVVLGNLGRLCLAEGLIEEAGRQVDAGLSCLDEIGDRLERAKLLCVRGELERRSADLQAARTSLAEAETLAEALGVTADSSVAREIEELRRSLMDTPA